MTTEITEQELVEARQIWGDALISISKAFEEEHPQYGVDHLSRGGRGFGPGTARRARVDRVKI